MGASTCSGMGHYCGRTVHGPCYPAPVPEPAPDRTGNHECNNYAVAGDMPGGSCGSGCGSPFAVRQEMTAASSLVPNTIDQSIAANYLRRESDETITIDLDGNGNYSGRKNMANVRTRRRWKFSTGAVYDGQWLGTARDGIGKMCWPDGAVYIGEWVRNTATGKGMFTHTDGDTYVGEWRSNLAHGNGVFTAQDGQIYIGQFFDDLQDGFADLICPDGTRFRGKFAQSRRTIGKYEWADKSYYEGEWQDNRIHGAGIYVSTDYRCYQGQWYSSMMHGCGRYSWSDGRCYAGQYRLDQKDGFGIYTWANGRKYEGHWLMGKQHHTGRLYMQHPTGGVSRRLARFESGERVAWLGEEEEGPFRDQEGQLNLDITARDRLRCSGARLPPVPHLR